MKIIVVGAGAGGLMAAAQAACSGAGVTLIERNEKPGKKRCGGKDNKKRRGGR